MTENMCKSGGFSLIEIIVVIAIIGLLSVIAVPNYLSYRNKAFCTTTENDAQFIAGEISGYFGVPGHTAVTKADIAPSNLANQVWDVVAADPSLRITITVQDQSGRCPLEYQKASFFWKAGIFTKTIKI